VLLVLCRYLASYPPDVLGVFVIDSSTGSIVVVGSVDFERQSTYTFTVTATDNGGLSCATVLIIFVDNVDEPPFVLETPFVR
jgi:hypothetical protein